MRTTEPLPVRDAALLERALAALTRATGIAATLRGRGPRIATNARPDAILEIRAAGKRIPLFAEIKTVDRAVALAAVKNRLEPFGRQGVLVAPYVTAELAHHCRTRLDLQFVDTAGNAYLRAPGLYVFIKGEKRQEPQIGTRDAGTPTALRVIFALLCRPGLLNAPYRDIVRAAGVALGAVGRVLHDLHGRGHLAGGLRKRNRRLLEPMRLLDEWTTTYPVTLRPRLNPRRFRAPVPEWWRAVRLPEDRAWWGGEVAADRLTAYLKPATGTLYIDPRWARETLAALVTTHRLHADPAGDVEILDAFWTFPVDAEQPDLVPPILVYADLLATLDSRNLEVATMIREQHIENALRRT